MVSTSQLIRVPGGITMVSQGCNADIVIHFLPGGKSVHMLASSWFGVNLTSLPLLAANKASGVTCANFAMDTAVSHAFTVYSP